MKFIAEIDIMPHQELVDPQGKTIAQNMKAIHVDGIEEIRIGKHISMTLQADSEEEAKAKVDTACLELLANKILETYSFFLHQEENNEKLPADTVG